MDGRNARDKLFFEQCICNRRCLPFVGHRDKESDQFHSPTFIEEKMRRKNGMRVSGDIMNGKDSDLRFQQKQKNRFLDM